MPNPHCRDGFRLAPLGASASCLGAQHGEGKNGTVARASAQKASSTRLDVVWRAGWPSRKIITGSLPKDCAVRQSAVALAFDRSRAVASSIRRCWTLGLSLED